MEALRSSIGQHLDQLLAVAEHHGVALRQILLTHAHIDHAGGTGTLARQHKLPIIGPHPGDQFWIDGLPQQSMMFGFPPAEAFTPDRWLADGIREGRPNVLQVRLPGPYARHGVFQSRGGTFRR
jgi:glyoxylase-like metal-dependent hydrolase (beta-lactamase superfamily II)